MAKTHGTAAQGLTPHVREITLTERALRLFICELVIHRVLNRRCPCVPGTGLALACVFRLRRARVRFFDAVSGILQRFIRTRCVGPGVDPQRRCGDDGTRLE